MTGNDLWIQNHARKFREAVANMSDAELAGVMVMIQNDLGQVGELATGPRKLWYHFDSLSEQIRKLYYRHNVGY